MRICVYVYVYVKNTDLLSKCKCNQHVKDRTFEGEIFLFRHDKVTMLFSNNMGIIYTKSSHYQAITRA